ncbi:MAG: hypothetical protein IAB91_05970 [Bacteroidetes bacterium]|uniref:Uncharacterized protein n=1 Tax=Candidatus Cryptobacteroides faecigallinarum TaxID=2840763 RepID=A0A9D9IL92_9BACT|nr:hypothetical protein [Candidatus Cryptobacteroides faecigallinarum]
MIVQDFFLYKYGWHVRVYYAVTSYWTRRIVSNLEHIGCNGSNLRRSRESLEEGNLNTGLTYSNLREGETVMVISITSTPAEFLNSWEHEKKHLARHIEQAYGIDPYSEEAAYLEGDIAQKMFKVANNFICEHCRRNLMG